MRALWILLLVTGCASAPPSTTSRASLVPVDLETATEQELLAHRPALASSPECRKASLALGPLQQAANQRALMRRPSPSASQVLLLRRPVPRAERKAQRRQRMQERADRAANRQDTNRLEARPKAAWVEARRQCGLPLFSVAYERQQTRQHTALGEARGNP